MLLTAPAFAGVPLGGRHPAPNAAVSKQTGMTEADLTQRRQNLTQARRSLFARYPVGLAMTRPASAELFARRGIARAVRGLVAVLCACGASASAPAGARAIRPLFEPTDLELEATGVTEVDLQLGAIRSQGPWRVVLPDFEVDVGLLPWLELDLDGAYAIEGPSTGPFSFDHAAPDSLWPSVKIGIYDDHDEQLGRSGAFGVQVGPKVPVAPGAHGLGVESLLLFGYVYHRLHTVLNAGGFVDPAPDEMSGRPIGIELGLDLELDLDDINRFSLTGEVSGVAFVSDDPGQLLATAGLTWSVTRSLDLSVVGLWGFLAGSDRYGALLGVSPKFRFLGTAKGP